MRFRKTLAPTALVALATLATFAAIATGGCRSPVASEDESGPAEDPAKVGTGVHGWPIFERDVLRHGTRTDILWPLSSVKRGDDGELKRAAFLIPVFLYEHDGARERLGVRPLFDVETDVTEKGPVTDWDVLWPLWKYRRSPDRDITALWPFWVARRTKGEKGQHSERDILWPLIHTEGGATSRFDVRPLWWSSESATGFEQTLFPVWWRGERGDRSWTHVWPLYGSETQGTRESRWTMFPFFGHTWDDDEERSEWDAFFPLFHTGSWRDGEHTRLLPLWWHTRDGEGETSLLAPFWFRGSSGEEGTPGATHTEIVFPFYGVHRTENVDRRFYGGNLLITSEYRDATRPDDPDATGSAVDVIWPIFHHRSRIDGSTESRVFPVYWSDDRGVEGYKHLWPVYGRSWSGEKTESSVLYPFFTYGEGPKGWKLSAPAPFVEFERRPKYSSSQIWPLVKHESHGSGASEGNILFLLSNWEHDAEGKGSFRILWRLVQDEDTTAGRHLFAVNPFFRRETNDRGDLHWSALLGLVARTREAEETRWRFLWFINL